MSSSTSRYAWTVVALLVPVALLNYLDRQMIAAMKLSVMNDIHVGSEANWGRMLGQFKWVYAFFSPIGGYLADRFSRRWVICGSLFAWSAVTWATGHVTDYEGLLWTRSLMGVSEAFYIPAALALIADYHTGPTRSRAVGIHQIAIYLGVITGGFSGYVADAPSLGWRWAFDVVGLIGVVYAIPLLMLLRDPERQASTTASSGFIGDTKELLWNRNYLLLVAYFTLPALAAWVVRDWGPSILQKSFNLSQGLAGVSATTYWQVAAIGAALLAGWLADKWSQKTDRGRIYTSAIGMALIIPAMYAMGHATQNAVFWMAIAALVLFGIGWGFFDINNMPILSQIVQPNLRATGYGIMNMVSISFGGVADWGFGVMQDKGVPLNQIFGLFALSAVMSLILVLMIRPAKTVP